MPLGGGTRPTPRYNAINSEETKVSDDFLSGLDRSCYFSVFAHDAIKTLFSKSSSARQLSRAIFLQHDSGFSTRLRIVLDLEKMLSAFLEEGYERCFSFAAKVHFEAKTKSVRSQSNVRY